MEAGKKVESRKLIKLWSNATTGQLKLVEESLELQERMQLLCIIKHEKEQFVTLIKMQDSVAEELSVHHNFNQSTAAKTFEMVRDKGVFTKRMHSPSTSRS